MFGKALMFNLVRKFMVLEPTIKPPIKPDYKSYYKTYYKTYNLGNLVPEAADLDEFPPASAPGSD